MSVRNGIDEVLPYRVQMKKPFCPQPRGKLRSNFLARICDMQKKKAIELREIEFVNVKADSEFVPSLDAKIVFKDRFGSLNELGVSFRIGRKLNSPEFFLFVGGYIDTRLRDEDDPINGIFFSIKNPLALSTLLSNLGAHFSTLAAHNMLAPMEGLPEESLGYSTSES
jgi:hypothetical protein